MAYAKLAFTQDEIIVIKAALQRTSIGATELMQAAQQAKHPHPHEIAVYERMINDIVPAMEKWALGLKPGHAINLTEERLGMIKSSIWTFVSYTLKAGDKDAYAHAMNLHNKLKKPYVADTSQDAEPDYADE